MYATSYRHFAKSPRECFDAAHDREVMFPCVICRDPIVVNEANAASTVRAGGRCVGCVLDGLAVPVPTTGDVLAWALAGLDPVEPPESRAQFARVVADLATGHLAATGATTEAQARAWMATLPGRFAADAVVALDNAGHAPDLAAAREWLRSLPDAWGGKDGYVGRNVAALQGALDVAALAERPLADTMLPLAQAATSFALRWRQNAATHDDARKIRAALAACGFLALAEVGPHQFAISGNHLKRIWVTLNHLHGCQMLAHGVWSGETREIRSREVEEIDVAGPLNIVADILKGGDVD